MELTLDRDDLLPEHKEIPLSATRLKHFKPEVINVVKQVGTALFCYGLGDPSQNCKGYNRIHV